MALLGQREPIRRRCLAHEHADVRGNRALVAIADEETGRLKRVSGPSDRIHSTLLTPRDNAHAIIRPGPALDPDHAIGDAHTPMTDTRVLGKTGVHVPPVIFANNAFGSG